MSDRDAILDWFVNHCQQHIDVWDADARRVREFPCVLKGWHDGPCAFDVTLDGETKRYEWPRGGEITAVPA